MPKPYYDLCAFKKFLRDNKVSNDFRKELRRNVSKHPWVDLKNRSKNSYLGLYGIFNSFFHLADVKYLKNVHTLAFKWNRYWEKYCAPKYLTTRREMLSNLECKRLKTLIGKHV